MNFKQNLKYLLECNGLLLKELSAKTGISENTIKSYLKEDSSEPKVSNAFLIAKSLNVSVESLLLDNYEEKSVISIDLNTKLSMLEDSELRIVLSLVNALIDNRKSHMYK